MLFVTVTKQIDKLVKKVKVVSLMVFLCSNELQPLLTIIMQFLSLKLSYILKILLNYATVATVFDGMASIVYSSVREDLAGSSKEICIGLRHLISKKKEICPCISFCIFFDIYVTIL